MVLSLEALQVLDAIERRGSFAAAAERLNKVPSAISYSVQKLEQDLQIRLFEKRGRRAELTEAGRTLLEGGRELLVAAEQLAERARQLDKGWERQLRIAVDSLLYAEALFPLIAEFQALNPYTEISLHPEVLGGAWDAIPAGRADLVVGAPTIAKPPPGLLCKPMATIDWVFAVAPQHPLLAEATGRGANKSVSAEQIAAQRAVVVRDSSTSRAAMTLRLLNEQPVLRVSSIDEKIAAQCAGLGVGYLPLNRVAPLLARGELVALKTPEPPQPSELLLVYEHGNRGRALRWFVERLHGCVESLVNGCQNVPKQAED